MKYLKLKYEKDFLNIEFEGKKDCIRCSKKEADEIILKFSQLSLMKEFIPSNTLWDFVKGIKKGIRKTKEIK